VALTAESPASGQRPRRSRVSPAAGPATVAPRSLAVALPPPSAANDDRPASAAAPAPLPAKRWLDLVLALVGIVLYLPTIGLAALAVLTVDPGPVFYAQKRRGKDGKPVRVWKLRTMYRDADARLERHLRENPAARDEWSRFFKLREDPRILPVIGRFLRRSSIDELPQLWNVLRGDMALVGPRPLPDYHLASFDADFRELRQTVVPGMTGLWQVSCRSDGDAALLRALDTFYVRNRSLALDVYILLRTVGVVIAGRGAR
jgi:lipopolysaccharide/colanic/teichoic acid biosynthesis glycosyltransferase